MVVISWGDGHCAGLDRAIVARRDSEERRRRRAPDASTSLAPDAQKCERSRRPSQPDFPVVTGRCRTPESPLPTNQRTDGGVDETHVVLAVSVLVPVFPAAVYAPARRADRELPVKQAGRKASSTDRAASVARDGCKILASGDPRVEKVVLRHRKDAARQVW